MYKKYFCVLTAVLVMTAGAITPAASADAPVLQLNLAAQPLADALRELAALSNTNIGFDPLLVDGMKAPALNGALTAQEALKQLLVGTKLQARFVDDKTVSLVPENSKAAGAPPASNTSLGLQPTSLPAGQGKADDGRLHLGQSSSSSEPSPSQGEGAVEEGVKVEEIIVTAQKRGEERLQDVPIPVTVLPTETLVNNNQLRLQDYYLKVPGLSMVSWGDYGGAILAIRGVTTAGNNSPTVGIVVDDVPFGASSVLTNGNLATKPDFDPAELSRIEVLRGPQGTLYGASSLGGLLKYVTVEPSTDHLSGRLQVGTTSVNKGDDLGYSVRGAVNVPINDTFAVRLSGSTRREPGYIDNVETRQKDVNSIDSDSARLAALWMPNDTISLKLSALYQDSTRNGSSLVQLPPPIGPVAGLEDLQQHSLINTGKYEQKFQAYSVTATGHFGAVSLTSLSGYNIGEICGTLDNTPFLGFASQIAFQVDGQAVTSCPRASRYSQEFRLSMPIGPRFDWLAGIFYSDERTRGDTDGWSVDSATGAVAGNLVHTTVSSKFAEYAAFTDLTFKISDRFDVQFGARASENETNFLGGEVTGPLLEVFFGPTGPDALITAPYGSKNHAFTYLVTPRFEVSSNLMVYARLASGYRPGGPNGLSALIPGAPTDFKADTTRNYEIGVKGGAFEGRFSFDGSIYYIDWKDIVLQISQVIGGAPLNFNTNAGAAVSKGAELSLDVRPLKGLTISTSASYNNAKLTDVLPTVNLNAQAGNRLPFSARWSGNLSVNQEFPLTSAASMFVGASLSYVGDRRGEFNFGPSPQGTLPGYTQLDLSGGTRFDSWTLNAFVNNVADKRGILNGGPGATSGFPYLVDYIQPRTVGLSLTKMFD